MKKEARMIRSKLMFFCLLFSVLMSGSVFAKGKTYSVFLNGFCEIPKIRGYDSLSRCAVIEEDKRYSLESLETFEFSCEGSKDIPAIYEYNITNFISNAIEKARKDDRIFLYIYTHGDPEGFYYDLPNNKIYKYNKLANLLASSYAEKIYVVLEACNTEGFIKYGVKNLSASKQKRFVVCAAADINKDANSLESHKVPVYTACFVSAFNWTETGHIKADKNRNGSITIEELNDYLLSYSKSKYGGEYTHERTGKNVIYNGIVDQNPCYYSADPSETFFKYKLKKNVDTSFYLSETTIYLLTNDTHKLVVRNNDEDDKVEWESSDKKVATVNSHGEVLARSAGKATITAKLNGEKMKCPVIVNNPAGSELKLSKTNIKLKAGETYTLSVKNNSSNKTVTWNSNHVKIAAVSKKGKITAIKPGVSIITAKVGKTKLACMVQVLSGVNTVKKYKQEYLKIVEKQPKGSLFGLYYVDSDNTPELCVLNKNGYTSPNSGMTCDKLTIYTFKKNASRIIGIYTGINSTDLSLKVKIVPRKGLLLWSYKKDPINWTGLYEQDKSTYQMKRINIFSAGPNGYTMASDDPVDERKITKEVYQTKTYYSSAKAVKCKMTAANIKTKLQ